MLDAYIIDRIRRQEREDQKSGQIPLYKQPPPPPEWEEQESRREDSRGATEIDFRL